MDLISRQAAIDALGGNEPVDDPSEMDDDDVVKMLERIRIINIINKLPSAQPERKKGKWIDETFKPWGLVYHPYKCDQCGEHSEADSNFCPNCGADMRGDKDDESRSNSNAQTDTRARGMGATDKSSGI